MQAIQFNFSIPRYVLGVSLGKIYPPILWSGLSPLTYRQIEPPSLPNDEWVLVKTHLGGICGTDLSSIHLHTSPYYMPLTSFPHTMGHENIGTIAEVGSQVKDWQKGERVVVEPTIWCEPRGFKTYCQYCNRGEINLCERNTEGILSAGLVIGNCRETGGSWGEYFVAHRSQLYRVPDQVNDETALLIEPFAVSLHAVLTEMPDDHETVLIIGGGTIGLLTLLALRILGSKAHILFLARHTIQGEAALKLGASQVINSRRDNDYYAEIAHITGAKLMKPLIGKRIMEGGVDVTFECVGSNESLDDAIRFTHQGGRIMLLSVPGLVKNVESTPIMKNELNIRSTFTYNHAERYQGKRWEAYNLVFELYQKMQLDLSWMVTHKFPIKDYARAFQFLGNRSKNRVIKAVFEM